MEKIIIPLQNNNYMTIDIKKELPKETDELIQILTSEKVGPHVWMEVARAYMSQRNLDAYIRILTESCSKETDAIYGDNYKSERVEVLCTLAWFHLLKASRFKARIKSNALEMALSYTLRAAKIDDTEMMPLLYQGLTEFSKEKYEEAKKLFEEALKKTSHGKQNLLPYIALGKVYEKLKQYSESLAFYKFCLGRMGSEKCPVDIRLSIGYLYLKLEKYKSASKAFTKCFHLYPEDARALRAMALSNFVQINTISEKSQDEYAQETMLFLREAYKRDPQDPITLAMLCILFYHGEEYDSCYTMAEQLFQISKENETKSFALLKMARITHMKRNLEAAYTLYAQAQQYDPKSELAHYGLAQMFCYQEEFINAATEAEKVLNLTLESDEAIMLWNYLKKYVARTQSECIDIAVRAEGRNTKNPATLYAIGQLIEPWNPKRAIKAYDKALERYRQVISTSKKINKMPLRFLNNYAILRFNEGHGDCMAMIQEASEVADDQNKLSKITVLFNKGKMNELSGEFEKAIKIYNEIIKICPEYLEAYFSLIYTYLHVNNAKESMEVCHKAMTLFPRKTDFKCAYLSILMHQKNWSKCKLFLDELVKKDYSRDSFFLTATGILHLQGAPIEIRTEAIKKRCKLHYLKALEYFQRAIESNPENFYAAHGAVAALCEMGRMENVYPTLQKLYFICKPEQLDVIVNRAHAHVEMGEFREAIEIYKRLLKNKRSWIPQADVMMYLARALHEDNQLKECRDVLTNLLHLTPGSLSVRFNLAYVIQSSGLRYLDMLKPSPSHELLDQVKKTGEDLGQAMRMFSHFKKFSQEHLAFELKRLPNHIKHCSDGISRSKMIQEEIEKLLIKNEEREKESRAIQAENERRRAEIEKKKKEEEERKIAEQNQRDAIASALNKDFQKRYMEWTEEQKLVTKSNKRKKNEYESDAVENEEKKQKTKVAENEEHFIEEDKIFNDNDEEVESGSLPPLPPHGSMKDMEVE